MNSSYQLCGKGAKTRSNPDRGKDGRSNFIVCDSMGDRIRLCDISIADQHPGKTVATRPSDSPFCNLAGISLTPPSLPLTPDLRRSASWPSHCPSAFASSVSASFGTDQGPVARTAGAAAWCPEPRLGRRGPSRHVPASKRPRGANGRPVRRRSGTSRRRR